ncbi:MAG: ABC transporter ATP-binding protein/permease [Lachnospiraceae bacterium]|nr:ABC transporter ATP-binding protein/permease [Lachnospiraceae bacterium]
MKNKALYKRILNLVKPHGFMLLVSLLFGVANVVSQLYIPIFTGRAIDKMIGAGAVDFEGLFTVLRLFLLMLLINGLTSWIMTLINNRVTFTIVRDLRKRLFDKIHTLPVSYIDSHGHGDLLSRIIADVDRLSEGLLLGFSQLFVGLLTIAATLIFMFRINVWITFVVIALTPLSLFAASFISRKTFKYFKTQASLQGGLTSHINETVGALRLVKAFGSENLEIKAFGKKNDEFSAANLKALFFSSLTNPVTRFVNGMVYAFVAVFGALLAISGGITVGTLSAFLSYANQYTKPFNEISGVITEFQNALASSERIFEFLDAKDMADMDDPVNENMEFTGKIKIEDLAFSYDKTKKLLYDLNLDVKQGSHIAIVGPTGCGKTTFINLLMRFYEPDGGEILYDGVKSSTISKSVLRHNIGMVLQDTWLKNVSIADNIAYGHPEATREDVIRAAREAHAHSFISRLEKGYDTIVSPDGENLSAGQKQLICIARVMLKVPPVLILDEATSSIDTRTEIRINKAFKALMEGRTSFIVAHRLSTIRNSDLILVMRDGNIIEQGTHEELVGKRGFYYQLLNA